ncbi:MAG: hypothetical protein CW691_09915 [Candidatus Bathyarchaeum sp.]|nr:MAG: hypothetical protein CW691_09915 [Candidatus Bathyarchaeum sp.]
MKQKKQVKLDVTDAKILRALLKEARTTFTEIAKDCGTTISGVRAKFLRLKKLGVINGAIMQINPYSFGYNCICEIKIKTVPNKEKEIIQFLENKQYTRSIFRQGGRQNISMRVMLQSINELEDTLEDVAKCDYVEKVEPLIWAKIINMDHPENLVIKPLEHTSRPEDISNPIEEETKKIKLDEKDVQIAKILMNDARTPFSVIGKKLKIPTQTVIRKYNRLRKSVLTMSTITVDMRKLGYNAIARVFMKSTSKSKEQRIYSELLQIPNMIVAIRHIGIYDIGIIVALEDFEDWFKVEEQIKKIEDIAHMDVSFNKLHEKWPLNVFSNILDKETKLDTKRCVKK